MTRVEATVVAMAIVVGRTNLELFLEPGEHLLLVLKVHRTIVICHWRRRGSIAGT